MRTTVKTRFSPLLYLNNYLLVIVKMSVIPPGVFLASKIRRNEQKLKEQGNCELSPTNYSSKYMNSVWGMYNRYAVHNLKKNFDTIPVQKKQSAEKNNNSADFKGSLERAKNLLPSANFF